MNISKTHFSFRNLTRLLVLLSLFLASCLARYDILAWRQVLDGEDNDYRLHFEQTFERFQRLHRLNNAHRNGQTHNTGLLLPALYLVLHCHHHWGEVVAIAGLAGQLAPPT